MTGLSENDGQGFIGMTIQSNTGSSNVYHIQHFLGRGSVGLVYRAKQDNTQKLVAVKLMDSDSASSEREIKSALDVDAHANLIQHFEAIDTTLKGYRLKVLVMELADGGSLRDLLNQYRLDEDRLDEAAIKKIAVDIIRGLQYLHSIDATGSKEKKRVHRDMKPENVLKVGEVWKIADFGLAKVLDDDSMRDSNLGYMPPEQLHTVSTKGDIWSFGMILKEMFNSNVPKEWSKVIKGCLVKNHKARWTADQVLDSLNELVVKPPDRDRKEFLFCLAIIVIVFTGIMNRHLFPLFHARILLQHGGNKKEALSKYQEAISIKPDYSDAYFESGNLKRELGDKEGAISDYSQAIGFNPNHAVAYHWRATLRRKKQEALDDYQRASELYLQQGNGDGVERTRRNIQDLGGREKRKGEKLK
jgi:serine/threonine protein kinase